jgi:hypothetical protein
VFASGTLVCFNGASVISVTATWLQISKPPGTDSLKSHLLDEEEKQIHSLPLPFRRALGVYKTI